MIVIYVGHYRDELRVIHRLPVTLARSTKSKRLSIAISLHLPQTSQGTLRWKVTRLTALYHFYAYMRSTL